MTWYTTHFQLKKEDEKTPTVGVEPTTFGLEVQRASPLRHAGLMQQAIIILVSQSKINLTD